MIEPTTRPELMWNPSKKAWFLYAYAEKTLLVYSRAKDMWLVNEQISASTAHGLGIWWEDHEVMTARTVEAMARQAFSKKAGPGYGPPSMGVCHGRSEEDVYICRRSKDGDPNKTQYWNEGKGRGKGQWHQKVIIDNPEVTGYFTPSEALRILKTLEEPKAPEPEEAVFEITEEEARKPKVRLDKSAWVQIEEMGNLLKDLLKDRTIDKTNTYFIPWMGPRKTNPPPHLWPEKYDPGRDL